MSVFVLRKRRRRGRFMRDLFQDSRQKEKKMDVVTQVIRTTVVLALAIAIWSCGDDDATDSEACADCDELMAAVEDFEETIEQLVVDYPEEFGHLSWR